MLQTESLLNPFKTELAFGERTGAFFSGTRRARVRGAGCNGGARWLI